MFVVAFLDSSVLSLPEINDLLLVLMVDAARAPDGALCAERDARIDRRLLVLYYIGRKGGEAVVRKRFSAWRRPGPRRVQRYGVLAVLVPSLLPPPAPFKIFVLLAGVAGISGRGSSMAIAIGRGLRYFGEGLGGPRTATGPWPTCERERRDGPLVLVGCSWGAWLDT